MKKHFMEENLLNSTLIKYSSDNSIVVDCFRMTFLNNILLTSVIVGTILSIEDKIVVFKGEELFRLNFLGIVYIYKLDFDAIVRKVYICENQIVDYHRPLFLLELMQTDSMFSCN